MSIYHITYELSSSISCPSPKCNSPTSRRKLQKKRSSSANEPKPHGASERNKPAGKLQEAEQAKARVAESVVSLPSTPTFRKRVSSYFSSQGQPDYSPHSPGSVALSATHLANNAYYSYSFPVSHLTAGAVGPISLKASGSANPTPSTPSTPSTSKSIFFSPKSTPSSSFGSPSPSRPRLSRRQTWSTDVRRRGSRLSLDISNLLALDQDRSPARNQEGEVEDFLAGGRENPNPYLYQADLIQGKRRELGLMSVAELRNQRNIVAVDQVRCESHGVMVERGSCSQCLVEKLRGEMDQEWVLRERMKTSWLDLDPEE